MNGLPYYKAYPRDFIEGTIGMPLELKGAYRVLLDLIYMQGGRLPDDPRYIAGLLGCSVRAWKKYRQQLMEAGKIYAENEIISNFRADKELETLRTLQDKQRENASGPRKNKDLEKPRPNHTEPEPDTEVKEEEPPPPVEDAAQDARGGSDETDRSRLLSAMGADPVSGIVGPNGKMLGTQVDMETARRWRDDLGLTLEQQVSEIRSVMAKKRDGPPSSFRFFNQPMQRLSAEIRSPKLAAISTTGRDDRERRLARWDKIAAAGGSR